MSFHAAQTFVFGEQPSASKWQYLWDNDYALADGTGISNNAIITRHILDSNVTGAKIASYRINRQDKTGNNTAKTAARIETGWDYIVGAGASSINKSMTFGAAFTSAPMVMTNMIGLRATSAGTPTGPEWFTTGIAGNCRVNTGQSTTGFSVTISEESAGTLANTNNYGFQWIAIGE